MRFNNSIKTIAALVFLNNCGYTPYLELTGNGSDDLDSQIANSDSLEKEVSVDVLKEGSEPDFPSQVEEKEGGPKYCKKLEAPGSSDSAPSSDSPANSSNSSAAEADAGLGKSKVLVCHVPPGNPAAAHNIIISVNGWINGHKDGHGDSHDAIKDYLGRCKADPASSVSSGASASEKDEKHAPKYEECVP